MILPFIQKVTDTIFLVVADVKLFFFLKIHFLIRLLRELVQPAKERATSTCRLFPSSHAHQRPLKLLTQGISHYKNHLHFSRDAHAAGWTSHRPWKANTEFELLNLFL